MGYATAASTDGSNTPPSPHATPSRVPVPFSSVPAPFSSRPVRVPVRVHVPVHALPRLDPWKRLNFFNLFPGSGGGDARSAEGDARSTGGDALAMRFGTLAVGCGDGCGGNVPGRAQRCKDALLYALEHDAMFNSDEVIQWESGKTINTIAAAQGISIRRRCRLRYPSEGSGEDKAVPRNHLEQIVWDKEVEVSQRKAKKPLRNVMESSEHAPPPRDFIGALRAAYDLNGVPALIAEVKKASPSKGVLRENFNPVEIAQAYEENGAACLSILTDEKHFQGSFENLETVRNSGVKCPLLCKEFVIDAWQLYYARSKGADAILLIAAVLPDLDMKYMLRVCQCLGMTALIEVHNERELDRVLKLDGVELIGINNRSLETFVVDTSNTRMLLEKRGDIIREKGILVVGESGLITPNDVAYAQNAGVSAVLVGESLIKAEDPGRAIAGLFGKELLH